MSKQGHLHDVEQIQGGAAGFHPWVESGRSLYWGFLRTLVAALALLVGLGFLSLLTWRGVLHTADLAGVGVYVDLGHLAVRLHDDLPLPDAVLKLELRLLQNGARIFGGSDLCCLGRRDLVLFGMGRGSEGD